MMRSANLIKLFRAFWQIPIENMDATYTFYIIDTRPTMMRFRCESSATEIVGRMLSGSLDNDHFAAYYNEDEPKNRVECNNFRKKQICDNNALLIFSS